MKQEHTPEPWHINGEDPCVIDAEAADNPMSFVAMTLPSPELEWNGTAETYANAKRIVACVNSCKGVKDPVEALNKAREALDHVLYNHHEGAGEFETRVEEALSALGVAVAVPPSAFAPTWGDVLDEISDEVSGKVCYDYRGRGMGDRTCCGIVCEEPLPCVEQAAKRGILGALTDNMGRDSIVYWRWLTSDKLNQPARK
jgi:hypothetical protein